MKTRGFMAVGVINVVNTRFCCLVSRATHVDMHATHVFDSQEHREQSLSWSDFSQCSWEL